jgi:hypothetical protein
MALVPGADHAVGTLNKKIDGVVIAFNDTTAAIMVEKELREVKVRLKKQIVVTLEPEYG